jgi:hypothetical protein
MGSAIHQAVLQACRNFMVPIARFLLRHGITYRDFSEVAKWAFVHVATEEVGSRGRKASVSRVAERTGLSRRDVGRCRVEAPPGSDFEREWRLAGDILRAWFTVSQYVNDASCPRPLTFSGKHGFIQLAERVDRGVDPAKALDLLVKSGAVRVESDGQLVATSRYYMPPSSDVRAAHHFGEALCNLATTIEGNYDPTQPSVLFERFVWSDALPAEARPRFHRLISEQAAKYLEILDDWLSDHEESGAVQEKVGVGIYFFDSGPRWELSETVEA